MPIFTTDLYISLPMRYKFCGVDECQSAVVDERVHKKSDCKPTGTRKMLQIPGANRLFKQPAPTWWYKSVLRLTRELVT